MKKQLKSLEVLKIGLNSIIDENGFSKPEFTRIFNFAENRVSLRLEINMQDRMVPVGRVDVSEIPSRNGKSLAPAYYRKFKAEFPKKLFYEFEI